MYNKKSRRTYGTGTVSKNRNIGRYTVIWTTADGKKKTCSKFPLTPVGKKQAEDYLAEQISALNDGIVTSADDTLGKWIKLTLESVENSVRTSTMQTMSHHGLRINKYGPELVDTPIADIEPIMIQRLYKRMAADGMAASTIGRIHALLGSVFKKAYTERVIRRNIMLEVVPPRQRKKEVQVFSWRQVGKVFRFLRKQKSTYIKTSHDWILFFRILHGTGIRIGEALALQWEDIDTVKREIHIHRTVSGMNGTKTVIEETKTPSGDRYIPILSNKTLQLLEEAKPGKTGLFIKTSNGSHLAYSNMFREWRAIKKATGVTQNIHCWRHTFATRMLADGYPLVEISRILGHSSPSITMDMYGHAMPSYNQRMIQIYNNRLKDN